MALSETRFFRALSDETRLRILLLLSRSGELCVCELVELMDVIQPKMSRHLAYLKEAGVVRDRREGTWIHYQLHPELPAWAAEVLRATANALIARQPYQSDLTRLEAITPRSRCAV